MNSNSRTTGPLAIEEAKNYDSMISDSRKMDDDTKRSILKNKSIDVKVLAFSEDSVK